MAAAHPFDLLIRKLESHAMLTAEDRRALCALPFTLRQFNPSSYLVREGEPPLTCGILVSGFAYRQKLTGEGARQIVSLHIPGEPLDFQGLFLDQADHNVQTLTHADVALVPRSALQELIRTTPGIAHAVAVVTAVEASIYREWMVNIGRRDGRTRLAHLLCEFARRLEAQGMAGGDGWNGGYQLPMTQEQLGDALGLTSVHINRTIRTFEKEGLIRRDGRYLTFPDIAALREIGDFNSLYLHLSPGRLR